MSRALQGFYVQENGQARFVSVRCWQDIELPHLQNELGRQRFAKTPPYCACHQSNEEKLEMHVRYLPGSCRYTLYRTDPSAHAPDCWTSVQLGNESRRACAEEHALGRDSMAGLGHGPTQDRCRFLPSMFLAAESGSDSTRSLDCAMGESGSFVSSAHHADYYDFDRYVGHCYSLGQVTAFCRANEKWRNHGFRQPTVLEVVQAIEDQLGQGYFAGESGFAAAKRVGCALGFGLLGHPVEALTVAGAPAFITLLWFQDGEFHSQRAVVPGDVWGEALRGTQIWGRYQSAPYLCFASSHQGQVQRLRLFPVFLSNNVLAPCDSGYERAFCAHLIERGCSFLKPLHQAEVGSALRYLDPEAFGKDFQVRYRPDFLVFQRIDRLQLRCWIVEVRGMQPGNDPAYDAHLKTKESYYQQLPSTLKYTEREGWVYQSYNYKGLSGEILGMALKILPDPEAVRNHRMTSLCL